MSDGTMVTGVRALVTRRLFAKRQERSWARATLRVGLGLLGLLVLLVLIRPLLGLPDPNAQDLADTLQAPSLAHPFGTDSTGRDVLSRSLAGLGLDLRVAVGLTVISIVMGVTLGALAGFAGGLVDALITRLADMVLAFPFLVLVIAIVAVVGPGLTGVYIGVPLISWAIYARFTRAETLAVREREYIKAAQTLGYSRRRILLRHMLPNVWRPSLIYGMADVVLNIVLLASLSYLGLGVQPPTPELGAIIADGQSQLLTAWWISTLPGVILLAVGVAFSLIGDGLAERLGEEVSWLR